MDLLITVKYFESVEFLIKSKFTAQKKSTLLKTQDTTTFSINQGQHTVFYKY